MRRVLRLLSVAGRAVAVPLVLPFALLLPTAMFLWDPEFGLLRRHVTPGSNVVRQ